jgi:hypothetical protein
MTIDAFRAATHGDQFTPGTNYYVDHEDRTVYVALAWANAPGLAADEIFRPGDPHWREEYLCACSVSHAGNTRHFPRRRRA